MTAISIDEKFIAVGFEETGVVFYWVGDGGKLEVFAYLPPADISSGRSVFISDLAYFS